MKKHLFKILALLMIFFIFSQSLLNSKQSSNSSGFFVNIINNMLQYLHINIELNVLSFIVRKLAHFLEFFLLGFFLIKGFEIKIFYLMIFILVIAVSDETIQIFSDGRAFLVTDILIDFCGGILAILLFRRKRKL